MSEVDATVFQSYAEYLWRRAGGIVLRWTIVGALLGGSLGAVMLTSWAHWPLEHREAFLLIALGAVSGAFLGRSVGTSRALGLRLQAQLAKHQLDFELSTLARAAAAAPVVARVEVAEPVAVVPSYPPVGVPPVSAVEPLSPVSVVTPAAADGYGWSALDPAAS